MASALVRAVATQDKKGEEKNCAAVAAVAVVAAVAITTTTKSRVRVLITVKEAVGRCRTVVARVLLWQLS